MRRRMRSLPVTVAVLGGLATSAGAQLAGPGLRLAPATLAPSVVEPGSREAEEALRRQLIELIPGAPTFSVQMGATLGGLVGGVLGAYAGASVPDSGGEDPHLVGFLVGIPLGGLWVAPAGAKLAAGADGSYAQALAGSTAGAVVGAGLGAATGDVFSAVVLAWIGGIVGAAFAVQ